MSAVPKTLFRRGRLVASSLLPQPMAAAVGELLPSSVVIRPPRPTLLVGCDGGGRRRTFGGGGGGGDGGERQRRRPDPMARRPTAKCDPYGQGGKPLSIEDATRLAGTVDPAWSVVVTTTEASSATARARATTGGEQEESGGKRRKRHPSAIIREFRHPDFLSAASFLREVAAVAQMNDHFPRLEVERKLNSRKKAWTVTSTVECSTRVLGGLSHHDFFLATLIDVEIERPELQRLLVVSDETEDTNDKKRP